LNAELQLRVAEKVPTDDAVQVVVVAPANQETCAAIAVQLASENPWTRLMLALPVQVSFTELTPDAPLEAKQADCPVVMDPDPVAVAEPPQVVDPDHN